MHMYLQKIYRALMFAGLEEEEYQLIKHNLERKRRRTLLRSSVIASVLLLGLVIASTFVASLTKNRMLYFSTFIATSLTFLLSRIFLKKHLSWTVPFSYVFLLIVYIFAIILGVPLLKDSPATTVCVLLFALPLLIGDKPIRMDSFLTMITICFCICSYQFKSSRYATLDITNAVSFLFLSTVVNYYVTKTKFHDSLLRKYIEKERDTDDLTKLLTKAAFQRNVNEYLAQPEAKGALMVIDIDNFKSVNDTMGHAFGDAVLHIMGECMKDVFQKPNLLARFGGDEFVIFLIDPIEKQLVEKNVQKLVSRMEEKLYSNENVFTVTGSIGVALLPNDATDYDTLFKRADEALYESKRKGKNCYTFYLNRKLLDK